LLLFYKKKKKKVIIITIITMPIRHFESKITQDIIFKRFIYIQLVVFTGERRLIQTSAVSQLKDTRLGIEGNDWLRKILSKETATTAMGGLPLRLTETIERELQGFK
jgi:hypothetical protein